MLEDVFFCLLIKMGLIVGSLRLELSFSTSVVKM
jgi:hypothetical protein